MPYAPTAWVNDSPPPLSAANLNKLTGEIRSQATTLGITNSLPTWTNGAPPALTDPTPLNEMERVLAVAATALGLTYTPTSWAAGWSPPRNAANFNRMEQQAKANRDVIEEPAPPPSSYTYRFATFNTSTDKVTGCLNRFQPTYSWWVPGTPEGTPWPKGGGVFPVTHPTYGPGLKCIVTDEMLYGNVAANTGPKDSNLIRVAIEPKNRTFFPAGNALEVPVSGTIHEWRATYMYPGGVIWPNKNYESMWELLALHSGYNNVYHHLYHRVSGGAHNYYLAWQHLSPTETPTLKYLWTQIQGPAWNAGDYHTIRWQIKWSDPSVNNGFVKAWTSVNGGPESQWANALNIPTKLSTFQSIYGAGHFGIRASLGNPKLETNVYNMQVKIT